MSNIIHIEISLRQFSPFWNAFWLFVVQLLGHVRLFVTHGLEHDRFLCSSLYSRICSDLCSLSQWCCVTTSSSATPVSFCFSLPNTRVFSSDLALCIMWPMYWSFSINPSNEYLGLISFRINWFDLLAVQGTQESSPAPELKNINSLVLRLPHGPPLTSVYDYWKNHSFDYMDCGRQSDVSAF